ncbi:type I secretion system permease/ATPase [Novispirillum sp. DQ9]|uniref:type I secretion system permease/ATPase n=1 Tax=Novispirillum sp. DQ9 TaxID=3398612 RepID=UPI003C7EA924
MVPNTEIQRAIRLCRTSFILVLLFSFAVNILALAMPLYLMQVYDTVLPSRSGDTLVMLTLIVLVALAVSAALDGVRRGMLGRIGVWLDDKLQLPVLSAAFQASVRNDAATGSQAWRDLGAVRGFLGGPAIIPLLDAPWSPIFIAALFLVHPTVGWIGTIGGILLVILAILNEVLTRGQLAKASASTVKSQYRLDSMMRNSEAIRAMGMLNGAARLLRADRLAARDAQTSAGRRSAVIMTLSRFLRAAIQVTMMCAMAWLVIGMEASPGAIFAASILLGRALSPVEGAIGTWKSLTQARLSYRRLIKLLAALPDGPEAMALPRPDGGVAVEKAFYVPPGGEEAILRNINLTLAPGEVLGILGPSGAGKSTLGRLIAGTSSPSGGHVRLDGADMSVWLSAGGGRYLGYLPQDVELFEGTVRENIARLQDADADDVIAAAKLVGIHEMIMRLPKGYDTNIGEGGVKLSGGQRQRVGLARAFFGEPSLVVLDEPNASLDREGEEALCKAIEYMKACGTTIVVIAHRLSIVNIADRLLVLREGSMSVIGARADILMRLNGGRGKSRYRGNDNEDAEASLAPAAGAAMPTLAGEGGAA